MGYPIKCPLCGKQIGERITTGRMSLGSLGGADICSSKYDYRKAAHVFFRDYRKCGVLCKKCGREKFPQGYVYYVMTMYRGKPIETMVGGDYDGTQYATKEKAERTAAERAKKDGERYWVKAVKI